MKKIILVLLLISLFSCDNRNKNDVKIIKEIMEINGYSDDDYDLNDTFSFRWNSQNRLISLTPVELKEITKLPESFGELEFLRTLYLSYFGQLKFLPKSFSLLRNLNLLHLPMDYNYLPEDIGLMNITILDAPNLKLTKLPKSFGELPLKELYLRDCAFNEIPQEICELEELEILIIYPKDRESKMVIPDEISKLKNLKELEIGGDIVRIPDSIGELQNLESLLLSPSKGLKEFPTAIYNLKNLEYLSMKRCYITDFPPGVSKLENLECFVLTFNRLTNISEELLKMDNWDKAHRDNNDGGFFGFYIEKNEIYDVTPEVDKWLKMSMFENWAGTQYYREK